MHSPAAFHAVQCVLTSAQLAAKGVLSIGVPAGTIADTGEYTAPVVQCPHVRAQLVFIKSRCDADMHSPAAFHPVQWSLISMQPAAWSTGVGTVSVCMATGVKTGSAVAGMATAPHVLQLAGQVCFVYTAALPVHCPVISQRTHCGFWSAHDDIGTGADVARGAKTGTVAEMEIVPHVLQLAGQFCLVYVLEHMGSNPTHILQAAFASAHAKAGTGAVVAGTV